MDIWDEEDINAPEDEESESNSDEDNAKQIQKSNKRSQEVSSNVKTKKVKYEDISSEESKKSTKNKNELYKPPTIDEINKLKETENLYNNNLFRLQIAELVKEVTIKDKRKKAFSTWLKEFQSLTANWPEFDDILLSDLKPIPKVKKMSKKERFIDNVARKYVCNVKTDQDLMLKFNKPEEMESFGLYENNSCPGPYLRAEINVKMPKSMLHVKDYLNNRYLVKRFYYLLYIAEHISAHKKSVSYHECNILLPILDVQPTEDNKLIVRIYVTPPDNYFKPSRFLSNVNNVKQDVFECKLKDFKVLKDTPTIMYNSALGFDVTLSSNNEYIKTVLSEYANIQEGIKLLCVWLTQRELNIGFGAFTEHLLLYLVTYLLVKKRLNKFMSSYQVIKNFWNFLTSSELQKNPISLGDCSEANLELFNKDFSIVFVDKTGSYNLASFLNKEIFKKVVLESKMALQQVDDNKIESFYLLFLTKVPFYLQYDLIIDLTESLPLQNTFVTDIDKCKAIGYQPFLDIVYISDLLNKGLNKRILNLVPYVEVQYSGTKKVIKKALFGINLNPETAFNFIELGPALSDHVKADEFRKFWGYLSSDRRFRDGSTHVAVYFKMSTIRGKRAIIKRIIKYLLIEKLKLKFHIYYDEFEEFLINKNVSTPYPVGTNEDGCLKAIKIADELGQKIRNFQMSLSIVGIMGQSEVFCYSEVFPPIASCYKLDTENFEVKGKNVIFSKKKIDIMPRYVQAVGLVLQLEHSSKWPNVLEGVRHIKTSFYLEISKMLQDTHNIISHVTKDYLDVFYEGLVFRYHLYVPKEMALMKKESTDTGVIKYSETEKSFELEKTLNILPKVNGALKGLQLQFPCFGAGTALIKRWLRSQLIDYYHLPDTVINLLNASLFVNNTAFTESCTPQVTFLRFLKFISEFNWELQPVIVNFNQEIAKEDLADLETKFQQNRDALQPLYIVMPYDQGQSVFTKKAPSKEILTRVQQLAESTLSLIKNRMLERDLFEIKQLFVANMEGYNVVIHLTPLLNPRRHEEIGNVDDKIVLEKYVHRKSDKIPIVEFSPVDLYLKSLRENYGKFAMFFHDTYGGNVIGVLWNPKETETKDFKVSNINGRTLENGKLILNIDAIIEDFYILGKELVKWIEKR